MTTKDRSLVEINLSQYKKNILELKSKISKNVEILQVVKADAYGHGAKQISLEAENIGISILGVANADEGVLLRSQDVKLSILILSPSIIKEIELIINNRLTPSVSSIYFYEELEKQLKKKNITKYPIHINLDTGMKRSGISKEDFLFLYKKINQSKYVFLEGVFSHYYDSENPKNNIKKQNKLFLDIIKNLNVKAKYIHISNSYGLLNNSFSEFNLVRVGILSFGVKLSGIDLNVKQIMTFYSEIIYIGQLKKNQGIGYNHIYKAKKDILYGIIPVGYADGYDYLLSNKGCVKINDNFYNLIGKISMDMMAVEIDDNVKIGNTVILIGNDDEINFMTLASKYKGNPYELACQIGRRAKRYFFDDKKKLVKSAPIARRDFLPLDFNRLELNKIIQSAIDARMEGWEVASFVYKDLLEKYFIDYDKNKSFREDFLHKIEFIEGNENYFKVKTYLTFKKVLKSNVFYIACIKSVDDLEYFFQEKNVEYRWIIDKNLELNNDSFKLIKSKVNGIDMELEIINNKEYMFIKCYSSKLEKFLNKKVYFEIDTITYYPKAKKDLTIYIVEISKNVNIQFKTNFLIQDINPVCIFSGKNKFPKIFKENDLIDIKLNEWVFPNSGVVFSY